MKKIICVLLTLMIAIGFSACGKKEAVNISVADLATEIHELESVKNLQKVDLKSDDPMVAMTTDSLGLDLDTLEEGYVIFSPINIRADMIMVLEAKDDDSIEAIKAAADKEAEMQERIWSQYLPDQYEKVKNRIVKTVGRYQIYIVCDNPKEVEKVIDEALKGDK